MSEKTTLLPCPFCGGEVELTTYRDEGYTIECENHDWPKAENFNPISDENIAGDIQLCSWGLGDEAKKALITAWNTRATHGTLTAEQVREAIERHSAWVIGNNRCFHDGAYEEIADEMNAELGSGTCEQVLTDCDDGLMPPFTAHCSACGSEWGFTPRYCHNCGAKVVGTRDERKAVKR